MRELFDIEIASLNSKIQILESASEKRNISTVLNTQINQNQSKPRHQSRILRRSCSKSLNRSGSKDNKNFISPYRPKVQKNDDDLSLQCKMYRKMILENSIWEGSFIEQFEKATKQETDDIQNCVHNLESLDMQFENTLNANIKLSKKSAILVRIEQYHELIKKQTNLIYDMRSYQCQLEEIIKGLNSKINSLFQQKNTNIAKLDAGNEIEQVVSDIKRIAGKWRADRSEKQRALHSQNKQLRDIVQEMIVLMNKKKSGWSKDYRSLAN